MYMSLLEAKKTVNQTIEADNSGPKGSLANFIGKLAGVAINVSQGYEYEPGTRSALVAKLMQRTGTTERVIRTVYPDATSLIGAGFQSIVTEATGNNVLKINLNTLGKSEESIYAQIEYDIFCLSVISRYFGEKLLPDTTPIESEFTLRPFGVLSAAAIRQGRIDRGFIDLFSAEGLRTVRSSQTGSKTHSNAVKFVDAAREFKSKEGLDMDVAGSNNVVLIGDGEVRILDYDPNLPDGYEDDPRYLPTRIIRANNLELLERAIAATANNPAD